MNLITKILGKRPAKEFFFISYNTGNAGISSIAIKTKTGYKDLLNYSRILDNQVEFKLPIINYVEGLDSEELITSSKARELAIQKTTQFHKDLANFYRDRSAENAKKEEKTVSGISF